VLTEVRTLLIRLVGKRKIDETPAALSAEMEQFATGLIDQAERSVLWANPANLPLPKAFNDGKETFEKIVALTNPVHRIKEIHGQKDKLEAYAACMGRVADFIDKRGKAFTDVRDFARQLSAVEHKISGDGECKAFLGNWNAAKEQADFVSDDTWKRTQDSHAGADLELKKLTDEWRAEAQRIAQAALDRLPNELKAAELPVEELKESLSVPLNGFLACIDNETDRSRIAVLPDRAVRLADGRNLPVDQVKKLADGRVFTGRQAKELGLVDSLGNYYRQYEIPVGTVLTHRESGKILSLIDSAPSVVVGGWTMTDGNFAEIDRKAVMKLAAASMKRDWRPDTAGNREAEGTPVEIELIALKFTLPGRWLEEKAVQYQTDRGIFKVFRSRDNTASIEVARYDLARQGAPNEVSIAWHEKIGSRVVKGKWGRQGNLDYYWTIARDGGSQVRESYAVTDGSNTVIISGSAPRDRFGFFHRKMEKLRDSMLK